jgi:putative ABC transport system permease protein
MNRLPVVDVLWRDVRYGLRVLRRTPAFTLTAIATLALAIGANTAVFSLADAILLRPLTYPSPERLGWIVADREGPGGHDIQESQDGAAWERLRDRASSIDVAMAASGFGGAVNLVADNLAMTVGQARVSAGYFRVLGVAPAMGREFMADEDRPGGRAVALLSHALWQRLFPGAESPLGRTIFLRGEPYEVVGVMPAAFESPGEPTDVWTPARPSRTGEGGGANYSIIARVRDGYTWASANGELETIGRAFFSEPEQRPKPDFTRWFSLRPLQDELVAGVREPIQMLSAAVAMVLLIACVNLAALLLARGGGRTREIATRMALGSGRRAVVRQLMIESLLLGLAGGAAGLVAGSFGLEALKALGGDTFHQWRPVSLDVRAIGATAAIGVITSLLFGLVPAIQTSRLDAHLALADGASRGVAGGAKHWVRRGLVVSEVALGVVLLVVTGLLLRTFINLRSLDPGFDPARLTTASVSLQDARYGTSAKVNQLFDSSLDALARTPGIESAAVSLELPYSRLLNSGFTFADEPVDRDNWPMANFTYVTPRLFETFHIPVRSGRAFADSDRAGAPPVAIVNETFVRSWGKGRDPIGRRIGNGPTARDIVGVVGDVQVTNSGIFFPGRAPGPLMTTPIIYLPAAQASDGFLRSVHTWFTPVWTVRAPAAVNADGAIRQAIAAADPLLPVRRVRSMAAVQAAAVADRRLLTVLIGVLAAAAVLLAAIGIHGLIAHGIIERTRELGIRLALGATPGAMVRRVVFSGVLLAATGAAIGLALSVPAVRLAQSFLWRVGPRDPLTYAGVAIGLVLVAAVSSILPAIRILKLDPAQTLRQ